MSTIEILGLYGFSEFEAQGLILATEIVGCHIESADDGVSVSELENLNETLQKCFIRPDGLERQQLNDKYSDEAIRNSVITLLSPFISTIYSGNDGPTKMLLGGSEPAVKDRFDILVNLEKQGNHAEIVYLLGGKRDLWLDHEPIATKFLAERISQKQDISISSAEIIVNEAKREFFPDKNDINAKRVSVVNYFSQQNITWPTESDLMEELCSSYPELYNSKIISVSAHKKINSKGELTRPDTLDTFKQFWHDHGDFVQLQANQYGGKFPVAIVTTQPYGLYQLQQAIRVFWDKPITLSLVAEGITNKENINLSVVFDSLARTIYSGLDVVKRKIISQSECR